MYFVSVTFQLPFTSSYLSCAEFLGANDMGDTPFLVLPYMPKGNARQYIQKHPHCNRLKIVSGSPICSEAGPICLQLCEVILGLGYLHSKGIMHGSLKAVIGSCASC